MSSSSPLHVNPVQDPRSPRFAILVQGAVPVNFSSVTGYVHWQAGLGIKFMLN